MLPLCSDVAYCSQTARATTPVSVYVPAFPSSTTPEDSKDIILPFPTFSSVLFSSFEVGSTFSQEKVKLRYSCSEIILT